MCKGKYQEIKYQEGKYQEGKHQEGKHQEGKHQEGKHQEGKYQEGKYQEGSGPFGDLSMWVLANNFVKGGTGGTPTSFTVNASAAVLSWQHTARFGTVYFDQHAASPLSTRRWAP